MVIPIVRERQRYVAVDRRGRDGGLWQVVHVFAGPGGAAKVSLFDVADPARSVTVAAAALRDPRRFRLVADVPVEAA